MKKSLLLIALLIVLSIVVVGCGETKKLKAASSTNAKTEITVSAAASLKEALEEIQSIYTKKHPEVKITYNFGSSGTLQQQIEEGAPVDLFISAGKKQMDDLEKKNLIKKETRINLIGNDLVLIVGKNNFSIKSFQDLTKSEVKNIGIGYPESVPAGKYSKETLNSLKLWDTLQAKLVQGKDVKQVLTYVETGNADAGFVYSSDAKGSNKVKVACVAPKESHKPIVYPGAVISDAKNPSAAEDFLNFLQKKENIEILLKYGFKKIKA